MIIFNWPERCPNEACRSDDITALQAKKEDLPEQIHKDWKGPECCAFLCQACDALWVERLVRSCDVPCQILVTKDNWWLPVGILSGNQQAAKKVLGIPEGAEYTLRRLEHIMDDGERRVQFVMADPKKAREIWLPGHDWKPPEGELIVPPEKG